METERIQKSSLNQNMSLSICQVDETPSAQSVRLWEGHNRVLHCQIKKLEIAEPE